MSTYLPVASAAVVLLLVGGLWISTLSMRRRLKVALRAVDSAEWTIHSNWYLTSARGVGAISERKVVVELVGTVQMVLRIAIECRTEHSARVVLPTRWARLFPIRYSVDLPNGLVAIAKNEGGKRIASTLANTEEGVVQLTSLFRDSSADLVWFGSSSFMAIFRRPARRLLEPQGFQHLLSRLLSVVSLIEGVAGPPGEPVSQEARPEGGIRQPTG